MNIAKIQDADTSYESFAEEYLSKVDEKPYNIYYERPAMISELGDVAKKNALDIGCGSGYYSEWLSKNGASVTAVDLSPKMVSYTQSRCGSKVNSLICDVSKPMPQFSEKTFDILLASLVMHYIKDWKAALGEFKRILKPSGSFIFSVHHPIQDYVYFSRSNYYQIELIEDEWKGFSKPFKVKYYVRPLNEIMKPLIENGFKIQSFSEPKPVMQCREKFPKLYEKLSSEPAFLIIKASRE